MLSVVQMDSAAICSGMHVDSMHTQDRHMRTTQYALCDCGLIPDFQVQD